MGYGKRSIRTRNRGTEVVRFGENKRMKLTAIQEGGVEYDVLVSWFIFDARLQILKYKGSKEDVVHTLRDIIEVEAE